MSDAPTRDPLDIQDIVARIERQRQESDNFVAEQRKLMAEADKFRAEERKLDRDRWLAPALAVAGLLGGIATVALTVARALHLVP